MNKIDAESKTVRELLESKKYSIDYYQREYKWKRENVATLLEDLEDKFLSEYEEGHKPQKVQEYSHYFLGPIIICYTNNKNFIIDGQQRLTTLTLLLIYLDKLQKSVNSKRQVAVENLIFSEKFGVKSFNIDVEERTACMESLFSGMQFDTEGQPESVQNIANRYEDIVQLFPDTLQNDALPYFMDWLIECVDMVEITAYSDDDAYEIFETMNDRGMSLSSAEMLKGYLLANIDDPEQRRKANELWKKRTLEFYELADGDEVEAEAFFKAWLRSQYADSIRERKKGAENRDWEILGTRYHKWVRDEHGKINLKRSPDFGDFVLRLFERYSTHYLRIWKTAIQMTPGLEYVYYNAYNNFTLQDPLILASIRSDDDDATVDQKMRLVAGYIDIFIARRVVNFRTLAYSSIVYTMFNLMKEIRGLDTKGLAQLLNKKVEGLEESFDGVKHFYMHQQNRRYVHFLLARITYHIENQCGIQSSFETYVSREMKNPFQVEHIWADKYDEHSDEFTHPADFKGYRSKFGGLLLLPKDFNQSYGKKSYNDKLDGYLGQNVLAKTLHPKWYENNPSFLRYKERSGLPFKPYPSVFTKANLDERQELYRLICEEVWNPNRFNLESQ
jgi:uncharacterized protein with ParB-like and HNH nuclease domain